MYAVMLAPLFNTYTRLPDGELRKEILELSYKLNFPVKGVYTVDGSKRSAHSNAFLMGFWTSSVVLYDTMVKDLSTSEILAILGHEIGHHKHNHNWKHLFMQLVFVGNFIFLFSKVVALPAFYSSFGFEEPDAGIGLVLFSYLYSTFANFLKFVTNLFRRRFEYEADTYALALGLDLRTALIHMHGPAAKSILPDPFFLSIPLRPPAALRAACLDGPQQPKKTKYANVTTKEGGPIEIREIRAHRQPGQRTNHTTERLCEEGAMISAAIRREMLATFVFLAYIHYIYRYPLIWK